MVYSSNDRSSIYCVLNFFRKSIKIVAIASPLVMSLAPIAGAELSSEKINQLSPIPPDSDLSKVLPITPAIIPQEDRIIPVGLMINGKNVLPSMNVRGQENGEKAVDFDEWLVPFDEIVEALKFQVKAENNGRIEISSPLFTFQLPADKLIKDTQLGQAISIKDLQTIPGLKAKFDLNKYAIDLAAPSIDRPSISGMIEPAIAVDGLATVKPIGWGVGAVQERFSVSGQNQFSGTTQGEFKAVGNIGDANWYLRVDQSPLGETRNWNIGDANIIYQRPKKDVVIGSQIPFWRQQSNSSGSYWGWTTIWRNGFTPPVSAVGGDFLANERLQSTRMGRSIVGQAVPGTLVQLVRGAQVQILQEKLVDISGVYRFDNVIVSSGVDNTFGQDYRVLLYPNAQLTANPETRPAQFITTPGQLPTGASALVVSTGANRITEGNFGSFDRAQGGLLYRSGVNENLTIGVGTAFDRGLVGVGDIFWQPNNIPLQVAVSATTGQQWDILGRFDYRPSSKFLLSGNIDQFSTRTDANWQLTPNFTALGSYDSRRGTNIGGQYRVSHSRYHSSYVQAEIDQRAQLKFAAIQRLNNWQFSHQSNQAATTTQVTYNLGKSPDRIDNNHELVVSHQSNTQADANTNYSSISWRYQSPDRTADGRSLWQTELGFGANNLGGGVLAGVDLDLAPGFRLRGSYRGASENGRDSYALELTSTMTTSGGVKGTNTQIEDLRVLGQLELTAFIDSNGNGRQDPGEKSYYDPLLFKLNHRQLKYYQATDRVNSATVKLPPDHYRLDIDPAGYPIDYHASIDAVRVQISAGNITSIAVPLVPAYSYTGVVQDRSGNPISGAKITATLIKTGQKISSITGNAGIYYLEGLNRGEYRLTISDLSISPDRIYITPLSKPTQELNLFVTIPTDKVPTIDTPTILTPTGLSTFSRQ